MANEPTTPSREIEIRVEVYLDAYEGVKSANRELEARLRSLEEELSRSRHRIHDTPTESLAVNSLGVVQGQGDDVDRLVVTRYERIEALKRMWRAIGKDAQDVVRAECPQAAIK